ncbi:glutathione S-transferase A2-like [Hydractinia symbiolongicarpus]|uniref:glutathione S-transferase A2-like n=1 Tax=Hydractinia symbiolongicarpus TaxID=13093 RepID=UPI00254F6FAA|nr:glutathione S-transferase A2-like [Hydractinia symbiolongicarpus]
MSPKYSLLYFDIRGRGEAIRMLFKYAGVEFEEKTISFAEFDAIKGNVKETPTGQIPVLTTQCGKKIVQTAAILRYVATELNLMGECNGQRALIDGIVVTHKEIHDAAIDIAFFTKEEEKPAKLKALEEKLHKSFKFYEVVAKEYGKCDNFVGKSISIADIYFVDVMDLVNQVLPNASVLCKYPVLKNIHAKTKESPNLKKYLAERK